MEDGEERADKERDDDREKGEPRLRKGDEHNELHQLVHELQEKQVDDDEGYGTYRDSEKISEEDDGTMLELNEV